MICFNFQKISIFKFQIMICFNFQKISRDLLTLRQNSFSSTLRMANPFFYFWYFYLKTTEIWVSLGFFNFCCSKRWPEPSATSRPSAWILQHKDDPLLIFAPRVPVLQSSVKVPWAHKTQFFRGFSYVFLNFYGNPVFRWPKPSFFMGSGGSWFSIHSIRFGKIQYSCNHTIIESFQYYTPKN